MKSLMIHYEYIVAVAEERSFSKAAQVLFVSQSSLSKYILQVEKTMGVKLFDRNTVPLKITFAGELFLEKARQILDLERQLKQQMEDIANVNFGRITIGVSPYIGSYIMPYILPRFYEKYPKVTVILLEKNILELERMAYNGEIDFALTSVTANTNDFICRKIYSDEIILATPTSISLTEVTPSIERENCDYSRSSHLPAINMEELHDKPFIIMQEDQILNRITHQLCKRAGFSPNVILENRSFATAHAMVTAGIGVTLLPYMFVLYLNQPNKPNYYSIAKDSPRYDMMAVYRKNSYLSAASLEFIQLVEQFTA